MNALAQFEAVPPAPDRSQLQSPEAQNMVAMGRMVSGVAHDFNNLLTCILLCADLLLAGLDKNSRLRHFVDEIRSAASQGASLVQQLTSAAHPSGESGFLCLNDVIADLCRLLERLLGENIQLSSELAQDLGQVKMSPAHARQIVLNLILNARDAMSDGGRLWLITRNSLPAESDEPAPIPCVELEVCDTGIGMDTQTRSRVFEPFFTTKSSGKGTGLGLTTVLAIVRQHQGTIQIDSEPGRGTKVKVRLPKQEFQNRPQGTLL